MGECILTRRESPFVKIKLEGKTDGGVSCAGTFKLTSGTNSMYMLAPPLRSVPTIPDKTSWDNGYKHTKNVSDDYTLVADDIQNIEDRDGIAFSRTRSFANRKFSLNNESISGIYIITGYDEIAREGAFVVGNIGKSFIVCQTQYFYFIHTIGTTLAQAKTALAGTVIRYQLATPIITPIPIAGDSDRIFSGATISPHSIFSQYYTTKISIPYTAYPIKNLLTIFKGATELDIADATIAGDKLSFTHTGLTEGDLVHITYEHTGAVTNTVEYE